MLPPEVVNHAFGFDVVDDFNLGKKLPQCQSRGGACVNDAE